jgi:hypothetical protein
MDHIYDEVRTSSRSLPLNRQGIVLAVKPWAMYALGMFMCSSGTSLTARLQCLADRFWDGGIRIVTWVG